MYAMLPLLLAVIAFPLGECLVATFAVGLAVVMLEHAADDEPTE